LPPNFAAFFPRLFVLILLRRGFAIVTVQKRPVKGQPDVRFGSKADICSATRHVRFTPNSDRKSRHAQMVMSALPLKADMCGALGRVCFGPKADSRTAANGISIQSRRRHATTAPAER